MSSRRKPCVGCEKLTYGPEQTCGACFRRRDELWSTWKRLHEAIGLYLEQMDPDDDMDGCPEFKQLGDLMQSLGPDRAWLRQRAQNQVNSKLC